MKPLNRILTTAIVFFLLVSLFISPFAADASSVFAQDEAPTPVPTEEPARVDTPALDFQWSVQMTSPSAELTAIVKQDLDNLRSDGVTPAFEGNRLSLQGTRGVAQLRETLFEGLPEGFDFLGGPVSLLVTYPATEGIEFVLKLEARMTTGYAWYLQPSYEFVFNETSEPEFEPRSRGKGVSYLQTLRLIPAFTGTGTLNLVYRRSFEPEEPVATDVLLTLFDAPETLDLSDPSPKVLTEEGLIAPAEGSTSAFDEIPMRGITLPAYFDWRTYGVVPPIRNQLTCGSCWAFGTVGIMESAINIANGFSEDLSEQFLISCNNDGWNCDGGLTASKYHYNTLGRLQSNLGAVLESDKPYVNNNSTCTVISNHPYVINDWKFVTGSEFTVPTVSQIKSAIYTYGPVTAGICVGPKFKAYTPATGDFSTNEYCPYGTNHQIILVGWNDENQTWILRNSWGTSWGWSGYMFIKWGTSRVGEGTSWVSAIPNTPTIVTPVSGLVSSSTSQDFQWNPVTFGTSYDLQIDNNSDFSSPEVFENSISQTTFTATNLLDAKYYWRVRAKNYSEQSSAWTTSRYFTIVANPPAVPVLSKPLNSSSVVGTPSFTWLASTAAKYYQVQYDDVDDGNDTYEYQSAELTVLTHKPTVTPPMMVPLYWSVRAKDINGFWSDWSDPFVVTIIPPKPGIPSLSAPAAGLITNNTNPLLSWKAAAYANTYEIQLDDSSTFTLPLLQEHKGVTELSHAIDALVTNTKYYWRVRAVNLNNEPGAWSAARSFTYDNIPPLAPVLTKPLDGSEFTGTPTFTWLASATAKYYQVMYDDATDGTLTYDYLSSDTITTLTHKPAVSPPLMIPLYWQVRARDVAGNWSEWSASSTVKVIPPVPVKPTLLAPAAAFITNNVTPDLSWKPVAYANTYEIQVDTTSTFLLPLSLEYAGITDTHKVLGALAPGKYFWRVRARNVNDKVGSWSAYRDFTIDTTPPLPPVLSKPLNGGSVVGTPTFTWLASATAKYYQVMYDDTDDGTSTYDYLSPETLTTLTHKPALTPPILTPLYWQVRARDVAGNWSDWSAYWTVTVNPPVPVAPSLSSPATGYQTNSTSFTVAWNTVPYGNTYQVQVDDSSTFGSVNYTFTSAVGANSMTIGPMAAAKYYWHVRAVNAISQPGPWSTSRSFTIFPSFNTQFNSDGNLEGWISRPGTNWNVAGGSLYTNGLNLGYSSSASYGSVTFKDLWYSARMKMTVDPGDPYGDFNSYYGLVVRATQPFTNYNDWNNGYYFSVAQYLGDTSCFIVFKITNGLFTNLPGAGCTELINYGDWNTLEVHAKGSVLEFFVNSTSVWKQTVSGPLSGNIGVFSWSENEFARSTYVDWAVAGGPFAPGAAVYRTATDITPWHETSSDRGSKLE